MVTEVETIAVILVDHGSRREASNAMLEAVADAYARHARRAIVEPAHMELAAPSLGEAFDRCVERGARHIVIHPYFLLPGRHSTEDIPRLTAAAAARHPEVRWTISEPLGLHPGLLEAVETRVQAALHPVPADDACS